MNRHTASRPTIVSIPFHYLRNNNKRKVMRSLVFLLICLTGLGRTSHTAVAATAEKPRLLRRQERTKPGRMSKGVIENPNNSLRRDLSTSKSGSSKGKGGKGSAEGKGKGSAKGKRETLTPDRLDQEPAGGGAQEAPSGTTTLAPGGVGLPDGQLDGIVDETGGRVDEEETLPPPNSSGSVPQQFIVTQSARPGKCLGYDSSLLGEGPLRMFDCTNNYDEDLVRWEKIDLTTTETNPGSNPFDNPRLFKLRHAATQLCIPQNPEFPGESFDCFESMGGPSKATADSINGLVNCADGNYPAVLGHLDESNRMFLQNKQCMDAGHFISLVSFIDPETSNTLILWGEQTLLSMDGHGYDLEGGWIVPNS